MRFSYEQITNIKKIHPGKSIMYSVQMDVINILGDGIDFRPTETYRIGTPERLKMSLVGTRYRLMIDEEFPNLVIWHTKANDVVVWTDEELFDRWLVEQGKKALE